MLAPLPLVMVLCGITLLAAGLRRRGSAWPSAVLVALAIGGLLFQGAHTAEHVAQVVQWGTTPSAPAWLSPWAVTLRDGLAVGGVALGNELLHLLGNLVFLVGALALLALVGRGAVRPARPGPVRAAVAVQVAHVVEHVALTVSVLTVGRPIGVTTLFGTVEAGPDATALRVLAHFMINAVASGLLVHGLGRSGVLSVAAAADARVARRVERRPDLVVGQRVGGVAVVGADREDRADHGAVSVDDR